jgi:hypothetical protein
MKTDTNNNALATTAPFAVFDIDTSSKLYLYNRQQPA